MWGLRSCEGRLGRTRFEDDTKLWVFYDTFDDVAECFPHANRRLGRRLDELATHLRCKRSRLCGGHLAVEFLGRYK
jgi:hypothetical protein